jgi:hypothetical protein
MLFAGGFGDQHAAMAGGAMQKASFVLILRIMLGANWIVGAKATEFQCRSHVPVDVPSGLNQTAERAFGVWGAGVKQDAVASV